VWLTATAALKQHTPRRAIEYLKLLLDKVTPDATTLTLLGNAYLADGRPDLALRQFEAAAALDPENPTIKTSVAISKIDSGQTEKGLAQLEQLFAGEAVASVAGPTLVLSELRAGRVGKAAEVVTSLVEREPASPLYLTLLGEVRAAQQDYVAAETAFRTAQTYDPGFTPAGRDLAQLYIATGRADDAKKVYADLLSEKTDNPSDPASKQANEGIALLGLADIAITEKKWTEAIDYLNRARIIDKYDPTPGLKLVNLFEMRADWNSAKTVAVGLGQLFPLDANVAEAQGRTSLEAGDPKYAIASYKLAQQLALGSIPVLSRYIGLLRQAGYFRDARDVLQDAVKRNPQNALIKADLIQVEAELDGLDTALYEAKGFAKDDPDNSLYDRVSAELYEKAGRAGDAAALLERAVAARPADDDLRVELSRLYTRTGSLAKAETVLIPRLQVDPKNTTIGSALAAVYLITGRPNDASQLYRDVLSEALGEVVALMGLADIAVAEKRWPEAMDYIGRARTAAPNDPAVGLALINIYGLQQDWNKAVGTATEMVKQFPTNLDVIDKLGRVQIEAGDSNGALSTYERAYMIAPNSSSILSSYLGLLRSAKKFPQARTVLRAALKRDPQNASLKGDLISVEAEIAGLEAGLATARNFARDDPENSRYDRVSAELYEKAGRSKDAADLLEKAAVARPSDSDLTIALSRLYRRMDVPAKAEAVLKARLKAAPEDFAAGSALAFFYVEQKQYDAAVTEYSRLVEDRPADPSVLNNLAWLYQRQGETTRAREYAQRAFAISPRDPHVDDTLGWILVGQGEAGGAIAYLSAANLAAPRDPDIQYHLAVALHRVGRPADAQAMLETLLGSGASFADRAEAQKLLHELKPG
jgi:predicted Zn-dependent protease